MDLLFYAQRPHEVLEFVPKLTIACQQQTRPCKVGHSSKCLDESLMIFYRAKSRDAGEDETIIVQAQRPSLMGASFWPANFPANWNSVRDHRHVLPMVDAGAAIGHLFRDGDE